MVAPWDPWLPTQIPPLPPPLGTPFRPSPVASLLPLVLEPRPGVSRYPWGSAHSNNSMPGRPSIPDANDEEEIDLDSALIWAIRYLEVDAVEEMLSEGECSCRRAPARCTPPSYGTITQRLARRRSSGCSGPVLTCMMVRRRHAALLGLRTARSRHRRA